MDLDIGQLRFDRFTLDPHRREVLADGAALPLQPRAFDILEYLVRNHLRPVSRDEILAQVFRDVTVLPSNVSVQIHALRTAFRKAGCDTELIRTLPQQRYQFVGAVSRTAKASDPGDMAAVPPAPPQPVRPSRRSWAPTAFTGLLLLAILVLLGRQWFTPGPSAPPLSMIVLPFANRGADPSQEYRVDAITDDLNADLARIPGSMVIARETAGIYKQRDLTARQIGQALNVRYLLDGAVEPDNTQLAITVSLTDTASDSQIWSTRFSVPRDRIGNATGEIVGRLAAALDVKLIQTASDRALRDHLGAPDALDLFYRARSILDRHAALEDYQAAQALLEQATADQSDFVDGFAELGWVLAMKVTEVDDPNTASDVAEARSAIAHALALSPTNPRALAAQGRFFSIDGNYAEAIESAKAALAAEPNRADALLVMAYAAYYSGHLDEAIPPLQAMLRINPEGSASKLPYQRLGTILVLQGRAAEALVALNKSAAGEPLPAPGAGQFGRAEKTQLLIIAAEEMLGNGAEAHAHYVDFAKRWPYRSAWRIGAMSPRTLTGLPGFHRFLDALVAAGMPMYVDETEDAGSLPSSQPLTGDIFTATPRTLPQAQTLDTEAMQDLLHDQRPKLIIDVGTGTWTVPGATWQYVANRPGGNNAFVDSYAAPFAAQNPGRPIVIMSDGTYDAIAYNAALHLVSEGYHQVAWYRGGEEAWAKHQQTGVYARKD